MKKLIKRFKQISILILAITFVGCQDDNANLPKVLADFTYTVNSDTGVVTFINLSENATNYTWDFGDGGSSTLINPVRAYQNGTYTVVLKSSVAAGSTDTFQDEITILVPEVASLPISFDGANTKYDPTAFGGASFAVVANPAPGGSNADASNVGAITNSGAAYEGIFFELGAVIDLATQKTIKMNFWSDAPINVLMKLEEGGTSTADVIVSHSGSGWEELMFNFSESGTYSKLVIFVDGPGTTAGTFYLDDIMQIETPVAPNGCGGTVVAATAFPVDFEGCESFVDSFANDGSITTELSVNPDKAGINTSDYVLKVVKATGTSRWAGIQNAFPDNFDATKTLKMKVYSSKANVVMKIEVNSNPQPAGSGNPGPQYATITDANTWTDVEVTFTGIPSNNTGLNQIVIKPDNPDGTDGTLTDSEATYYFDDIEFVDGGGSSATAPTTAAPTPTQDAANVVSIFSDTYTDVAGVNYNPDWGQSGLNDVNASFDTSGGNLAIGYLNFNYQGIEFATQDLSTMEFMHVDVWTADATDLKVTPIGGGETLVSLTPLNAGVWNSYDIPVADFTAVNFGAVAQIKFDGQGGVSPSNIYVDNIYFYKAAGGSGGTNSSILDFENNLTGVTAGEFETSGTLITNPVSGTINTSANVYEASFSSANQWWGGVGFVFAANVLDDQATEYKVKLYSTVAPTNVLFQVEVDGTNAPVGDVQTITTANQWVEVTFNLANIPAGVNRILIRPDVGDQSGTKPNTGSLYIDDIVCVNCTLNSGGSGGGGTGTCPAPPAGELLSNGGFEANGGDGSCWQFNAGGGTSAVSTTEVNTGTYSAKLVSGAGLVPNIKMERFAPTIAPGTTVQVTFKYKFTTALGTGSILQVLAFSEKTAGAVEHNLGNATDQPLNTWNTFTNTFVTSGDIVEGISLLLQLTGSGNADGGGVVYIDDVQVTQL